MSESRWPFGWNYERAYHVMPDGSTWPTLEYARHIDSELRLGGDIPRTVASTITASFLALARADAAKRRMVVYALRERDKTATDRSHDDD